MLAEYGGDVNDFGKISEVATEGGKGVYDCGNGVGGRGRDEIRPVQVVQPR